MVREPVDQRNGLNQQIKRRNEQSTIQEPWIDTRGDKRFSTSRRREINIERVKGVPRRSKTRFKRFI